MSRLDDIAQRERLRLRNALLAEGSRQWAQGRDDFSARVVPSVLAAQRRAVQATDAYISAKAGVETRSTTQAVGVDPDAIIGRRSRQGVFLEDVYDRPAREYQRVLAETGSVERAERAALRNFQGAMLADVQLAERNTAAARMVGDRRIVGWRRVLGPGENCGLCIAASTRTYTTDQLMAIHTNCRCGVQPIVSDRPLYARGGVGEVVDRDRLRSFIDRLDDGTAYSSRKSLGDVRMDADGLPSGIDPESLPQATVVRHGELGPFLYVRGQRFASLN